MFVWLAKQRRALADTRDRHAAAFDRPGSSNAARLAYFFAYVWTQAAINTLLFLVELPFYLIKYPTASFEYLARRDSGQSFLDSYSDHLRKYRLAIASVMLLLLAFAGEIYILTRGIITVTQPTLTQAFSTTVDLNPTWDITTNWTETFSDGGGGACNLDSSVYTCTASNLPTISFGQSNNPPSDCTFILDYQVPRNRAALKFSLSSIPDNATITAASLLITVTNSTNQTVTVYQPSSDNVDSLACNDGTLYNALNSSAYSGSQSWITTGQKTVTLNGAAVSGIQSRITSSDVIALGIVTAENSNDDGDSWSNDAGTPSNRPTLRVTYTLPPNTPTDFAATGHTTSTIDWEWTDNTTDETSYAVHDASHAPVTGCSGLAANAENCTETGLSPNTKYTRHANVIDADGNADSGSASTYTSIQTPTGIAIGATSETSMTVSATGTSANLTEGLSGLWFEETVTSTNSGWIQTNSWQKNGLSSGTQYSFRVKARNGDGDETPFTSLQNASTDSPPEPTPEPAPSTVSTPTITNLSSGDTIIEAQPRVSGQGPANAAIFIVTDRAINTVVLSNASGTYSVVLAKPLSLGSHEIIVRARTSDAQVSDESDPITLQRVLAGIPVTVRERSITNGAAPSITFEGVAPTNSTVRILLDGKVIETFTAAPSPTSAFGFSRTVTPPADLSVGTHTLSFLAINTNGRSSLETGITNFTKTSAGDTSFLGGTAVNYTVQPGDSLWKIAETFLSDGTRWNEIRQANLEDFPSLVRQPTLIHAGWTLSLPSG